MGSIPTPDTKNMIELEKNYLVKYLPPNLEKCESKEVIDIYLPKEAIHPTLRIRKNGNNYEITKKEPITEEDASSQTEQTIPLKESEFLALSRVDGNRLSKIRYFYPYNNRIGEIGIFQEALSGLVLVDFEFKTPEEKESFKMPEFCLADVTQEEFLAGGMLCGKSYQDIEERLKKLSYSPIVIS